MIFSRNRGANGKADSGKHTRTRSSTGGDPYGRDRVDEPVEAELPEFGPYDVAQAPDSDQQILDLGAMRIPLLPDVDIQLEAGPQGQIQRVQLAHQGSLLQLGAFAAPRTEGIWDDVRATLRTALTNGGAKPVEIDGEYGVELQARVRDQKGTVEVRHIGIDGPRWFVHGVYVGAAAVDPDQAGPLRDALRGLVVDRGAEARPVSEALPLRLPAEAAAQLAEIAQNGGETTQSQAT